MVQLRRSGASLFAPSLEELTGMKSLSWRSSPARAAALGITAGLRSQLPLALLARTATGADPAWMGKRLLQTGLYLSAAGEMLVDKLPVVPGRIEPGPLAGRIVFGSLSGAIVAHRTRRPAIVGIAAGAAGAVAGSFAGYHARVWAGRVSGLPDPVWAVVEDAIALRLGTLAARD
jgi:uncharacterized membrane protein